MKILNWQLFLEELVGETSISDVDSYISGMEKGMQDKLFFVNKVDFDVIVDFGCANGSFLSKVQALKPNVKIIGYDLDDNMLNKARSILDKNALLTSNWSEVISELSNYESPLLNLSSVIHEVYSYSHSSVIKKFWQQQVFGGSFKTITIRDMIPSSKIERNEIENFKKDVTKVRKRANSFYLDDFEKKWGSISDNYRTFCHFLLKYKYISNWDREVIENYLPVSLETLKKKIPSDYSILFEQDFILPYTQQELGKDFGIKITHSTHIKMIIERNK
jgi:23S rRNA U2552 (ribose-2'-O)-methylase RlmE/FtsJ